VPPVMPLLCPYHFSKAYRIRASILVWN
jgi:hypothetical protein